MYDISRLRVKRTQFIYYGISKDTLKRQNFYKPSTFDTYNNFVLTQ